jgi:flagellin-specific chaperone FliS
MKMINPNNIYGKYQTSTLTPEEIVLRLHEKILERIETIKEAIGIINSLKPMEFERKKEQIELISKELDLIIDSVDVVKSMLSDETPEELRKRIESVYNLFKVTIIAACHKEDLKKLEDAKEVLIPLYEGWKNYLGSEK